MKKLIRRPKLTPTQWKMISQAFSNISQAIVLFSAAAFFVPEAVGLNKDFSKITAFIFSVCGLILLTIAVIISRRGE